MAEEEPEVEQNEELQKLLGTSSFGKQEKGVNIARQVDASKRSVYGGAQGGRERGMKIGEMRDGNDGSDGGSGEEDNADEDNVKDDDDDGDDDDEDDDDDSDSDEDDEEEFPISHEMVVKTHEKAVTAVTLDPSGARMITGSMDCTIKLHDFASMTPTTIRAFKSVDPSATKGNANAETHPVHQVLFNPLSASHVLVATALPQARILSRDGDVLCEFAKGDMYLRDMKNTKGHVSEITTGTWHPTERDVCVTGSTDSTLRIWDVNRPRAQKEVIVHKSRAAGNAGRSRMSAVCWGSPMQGGNNMLVGAAMDGSLVIWSGEGPYARPAAEVSNAHIADTWTSGLDISADGRLVVSRGGDDTIKLWDTRKFKQPIVTVAHASTSSQFSNTNICFSPNSANVLTGSETGHLHILNSSTLRPESVTPVTPGSPLTTVLWHAKLNQIVTGSANAETHVLYSPNLSSAGGAQGVMGRAPKRRHIDDDSSLTTDTSLTFNSDALIAPGGQLASRSTYASRHPTIGLTASGRSRDPRRPHLPAQTPFAKGNPDEAYVRDQIPLSSLRDEDPREALLKYADKAEKDPLFTNAWKETQPKTIYAELSDDEDEDGPEQKRAKR